MTKKGPTIYDIVYEILNAQGDFMTLDTIVDVFKEINPKHDKYNYRGNIKQAVQLKNKITQIENNVFGLTRWLVDGRRFRIKPDQDNLMEGLYAYDIPEINLLFSGVLEEEEIVEINDPRLQKTYELEPAWDEVITRKRLQGLEDWYLDAGFKPGDEFIITCIDFERGRFEIEYRPSQGREDDEIQEANQIVCDTAFDYISHGKVIRTHGAEEGYWAKNVLLSVLAAGTHNGAVIPDGIADVLLQDSRLVVKERNYIFLRDEYNQLYPDDDFESLSSRLIRHLEERLNPTWDLEDEDDLIDLAAHLALAESPVDIIRQLVEEYEFESDKDFEELAGSIMVMWNETPRPELGFKAPNEVASAGHGRIVPIDFANRRKAGRNDPCPCGSGKKYKKCCLPRDEAVRVEDDEDTELLAYNAQVIEHTLDLMDEDDLVQINLSDCRPHHRFLIAQRYRKLEDDETAIAILEELAESKEEDWDLSSVMIYLELVLCYSDYGNWPAALDVIRRAKEYANEHRGDADRRVIRLIEANLYLQSGDSWQALEICRELEKEDPEKPFNYVMQATAYVHLNDYKNALFYVNKAGSVYKTIGESDPDLMNRINLLKAYIEALVKREE